MEALGLSQSGVKWNFNIIFRILWKKLPLPKLQYPTKYSYLKQAQALLQKKCERSTARKEMPWIVVFWCLAHGLELAIDEMLLRMYNILFFTFKHHIDKKPAEYKFSFYRKQHKQLYFDETLQKWNQRLCSGAHWDGRHQRAGQSSPLLLCFI